MHIHLGRPIHGGVGGVNGHLRSARWAGGGVRDSWGYLNISLIMMMIDGVIDNA